MPKYIESHDKKDCFGCSACASICPVNAIKMVTDKEGFKHPVIDQNKCIDCGLCKKVCIDSKNEVKNYKNDYKQEIYAAINKNEKERLSSSSGGIFSLLAKYVIKNKGIVFGVKYDKKMKAIFSSAETLEALEKLKKSKYVEAEMGNIFKKIKNEVLSDRLVLFVGTPCQCMGLQKFMFKVPKNLIICDIICHSNPSPKTFEKYIELIEKKYNKKLVNIDFRDKTNGWHKNSIKYYFEDNSFVLLNEPKKDFFYKGFLGNYNSKLSCYSCQFSYRERISDITIADFWGIEFFDKEIDDNKGVSVILVNSIKGKNLLDKVKKDLNLYKKSIEEVMKHNHNRPIKKLFSRNIFFFVFRIVGFKMAVLLADAYYRIRNWFLELFSRDLRNKIKKILKRG